MLTIELASRFSLHLLDCRRRRRRRLFPVLQSGKSLSFPSRSALGAAAAALWHAPIFPSLFRRRRRRRRRNDFGVLRFAQFFGKAGRQAVVQAWRGRLITQLLPLPEDGARGREEGVGRVFSPNQIRQRANVCL